MIVLPAIDLKDGKVVRLYKGDFGTVHQVAEDPAATAKAFAAAGAKYVHMVDLDGAKSGIRVNSGIVRKVAAESGLLVELGGGIRTMDDLRGVDSMGVYRMVIGSAAVTDPDFVAAAVAEYGDRIAVGVDAENGHVKTSGWIEDSGLDYLTFSKSMEALGVRTLIFTDIETDGALSGPSFQRLVPLTEAVSCRVIASGGVSSNQDIRDLASLNVYGAIIGKAYYSGMIDLAKAIHDAGPQ